MKKATLIRAVLTVIFALVAWLWLFSESAAQLISVAFVLAVPPIVLAQNIEKEGMRTLLLTLEPVPLGLCKILANTKFAEFFSGFCNIILEFMCGKMGISPPAYFGNETSLTVFFWTIFVIAILLLGKIDRTAMGIHNGNGDSEFRERNYSDRSVSFCQELRQRLETLNRETDWNENLFTPIDAEVEVNINGKHKRKYTDLLKCLKKTRRGADVFLVLGDPGAGKSVSLRKLCLELLDEAKKTKKIPVYINLKKWNKNWNLDQLPNKNDLIKFVKESLYENGDIFTDEFLNSYFDKMLEDGRWYFVFDSFDEMPCLMGKQNCQELIDHISELLFQFLTGRNQSGGVIASRLYKAPSDAAKPTVILRIQEFNDIKIQQMLKKYLTHAEEVVKELFGKREDLVVLCRNPFYLTLLINFVRERGLVFPKNQMELYSNFVEGRLKKCAGKLECEHFSKEDVHNAAKKLAVFFQESVEYGLECPARELYQQTSEHDQEYWRKALKILEYAKICRFGGTDETVSFVHRRFQEFFFVEHIIERHQDIGDAEYSSITYGSGLRDALVLYCDVAEEEKAHEIAEYCWNTIQKNIVYRTSILTQEGLSLVNVLDFMAEAFRNRKNVLSDFVKKFERLVMESLNEDTDFVILLSLTNSMVLFDQKHLQKAALSIFHLGNRWLNDAVMQNCRLIQRVSRRLEAKFSEYFLAMDIRTFLRCYRNTHFSLSISKSFWYIRIVHDGILLRYLTFIVATVLAIIGILGKLSGIQQFTGVNLELASSSAHTISFIRLVAMILMFINIFSVFSLSLSHTKLRIFYPGGLTMSLLFAFPRFFIPLIIVAILTWTVVFTTYITTFVWYIVFTIAFTAVYWMIIVHNLSSLSLKKIFKRLKRLLLISFSDRMLLISIVGHVFIIVVSILVFPIIERHPAIYRIIFSVLGIALLFSLTRSFIYYWKDRRWVIHRPNIQRINRDELAANLETLHFPKWKRLYVEHLMQNKTTLEGEWPEGKRPGKEDDDLIRILAKLDCISLEHYSSTFKI